MFIIVMMIVLLSNTILVNAIRHAYVWTCGYHWSCR